MLRDLCDPLELWVGREGGEASAHAAELEMRLGHGFGGAPPGTTGRCHQNPANLFLMNFQFPGTIDWWWREIRAPWLSLKTSLIHSPAREK